MRRPRFMLESVQLQPLMPKYVIEREMPGVGSLSASQLGEASRTSCNVLQKMSPGSSGSKAS